MVKTILATVGACFIGYKIYGFGRKRAINSLSIEELEEMARKKKAARDARRPPAAG